MQYKFLTGAPEQAKSALIFQTHKVTISKRPYL